MEDIRQDAVYGNWIKYGATKNPDGTFTQIGINADTVQELTNSFSYQNQVEELVKNEGLLYALVVDTNGAILASSDHRMEINSVLTDEDSMMAAQQGVRHALVSSYELHNETLRTYDILMPFSINGKHVGALKLGISLAEVYDSISKNLVMVLLVGLSVFSLLSIVLARISTGIANPIGVLSNLLERFAKYDLSFDERHEAVAYLDREDEIGHITNSLATMQQNLVVLIQEIKKESEQVASFSEELTATCQESSASAMEVAQAIEEIARGASDQASETERGATRVVEIGEGIADS